MNSDWTLVTVAGVFLIGTFYLVFSPDPLNDVPENRSAGAGTSPLLVYDDPSWGKYRMAVVIPFCDWFDELLELKGWRGG